MHVGFKLKQLRRRPSVQQIPAGSQSHMSDAEGIDESQVDSRALLSLTAGLSEPHDTECEYESMFSQVDTAVKFLTHPRVKNTPLSQRLDFLQKKGLNEAGTG